MLDILGAKKWLNLPLIAQILVIKGVIIAFAVQSYIVITDKSMSSFYNVFYIWKRWDATHYLHISEKGYTAVGEDRFLIVFYPLYPFLVAILNFIVGDSVISAFVVSGVASIALGLLFLELVKLDFSEEISQKAVLFLFIFPTAFVLHIPYTESLFLALAIGSFLAARKRCWILVGVLGGLACLTRINGLILFPALLFEIWGEYRETKSYNWKWLFLLLIPTGIGGYLVLNFVVTGDPFMFITHQREHWYRYLRAPWYGLWEAIKSSFSRTPSQSIMNGFQELLFVGIGFVGIVFGWRYFRASYRVWMCANWLLFISTSFVLSVPRYTIVLFPIFILMAIVSEKSRLANILFTVWSLMFMALFVTQFVQGKWAF